MDEVVIEFTAYNPYIKQLRTDRGWCVEFDVSETDFDNIKDLPKLAETVLEISVMIKGVKGKANKGTDDTFDITEFEEVNIND